MIDVVKKAVYDMLAPKVNNIATSDFNLKTKYQTDKTELENKFSDTSGLAKKIDCNTKLTELEKKIPDVSSLARKKTALTAVGNKMPSVSSLVKKTMTQKVLKLKSNSLIVIMTNALLFQILIP